MPPSARAVIPLLSLLMLATIVGIAWNSFERADARIPDPAADLAQPQGPTPVAQHPYDINDDGCDDLVTRRDDDGLVIFWEGTCLPNTLTQFNVGGYALDPLSSQPEWATADRLLLPGDMNSDGCNDLAARYPTTGRLKVYFGDCDHTFTEGYSFLGWEQYNWLVAPGDWDANGCPDVIGRVEADDSLVLNQMNCGGGYFITTIGSQWGSFDWLFGPNHWDGDNANGRYCGDIIGRSAVDDDLHWYDGNCSTGFGNSGLPTVVGFSWQGFDWIISGGDWDNDFFDCPDVIGRSKADGKLYLYGGDCSGGFKNNGARLIGDDWDWASADYLIGDAAGPAVTWASPTPTASPSPSPTPTPTATSTQTPTSTPTSTSTGTSTSTPVNTPTHTHMGMQGDVTCNGSIGKDDLRDLLYIHAGFQGPSFCFHYTADTDCDLLETVLDSIPLLLFLANFEPVDPDDCTPVGSYLY